MTVLAVVYTEDRQYGEARLTLDRVAAILSSARDAVPLDRIRLLHLQGLLHARQHQWKEAERDMGEAVTQADREKLMEPLAVQTLWGDYAAVLRKTHRRGDALIMEARATALRDHRGVVPVVDVTELLAASGSERK